MQTSNIYYPWDSIKTSNTWNNTLIENVQVNYIKEKKAVTEYIDSIIIALGIYIIFLLVVERIKHGSLHRENKIIEEG